MIYVIAYDIKEPKRLRKIYKIMEGQGFRVQFSLYFCELNKGQLAKLKSKIQNVIDKEDSILIVSLGERELYNKKIDLLGNVELPTFNSMIF